MSLRTEISNQLAGDANITALVGTHSYHGLVPLNYKFSNSDAIVYEARVTVAEHALDIKDWGDQYSVTVKALSLNSANIETIAEAIKTSLHSYSSAAIQDVSFERDNYVYDIDNNVHILSLDFTIWYMN